MDVVLRKGSITARPAGAIALGILQGEKRLTGAAAAVDRATRGAVTALLGTKDFSGRFLETAVLYPKGIKARRLILVGLGPARALDAQRVRLAAAQVARRARDAGMGSLATVVHGAGRGGLDPVTAAAAVAEGSMLGAYRFTTYRTHAGPPPLRKVELVELDASAAARMAPAVRRAARATAGTCLARDLASMPGNDLTPEALARHAVAVAKRTGATARVLREAQLAKLGAGALLAVGQGSPHPPRLVVLERAPRGRSQGTIVLIGKGITFDTGGISLKPRENMHRMKYDMSGAAAVVGVFDALPAFDLPYRVVGLLATAENMPGGRAFKPGDVVRALDGTTIEITNTDAEGRLVLADAIAYSRRYDPVAVVDLATLTGAISIALGKLAAGLFTRDDALADELLAAGQASGERLWRMPLWEEYAPEMQSDTADMVNSAAREGGSILAASFLAHFARGLPWAHLDIASTAWTTTDRPLESRGATGFGVRLLLDWLSRRGAAA